MKEGPYVLRGIILVTLALAGLIYEIFTDLEVFVFVFYGLLLCVGIFLIWKVRNKHY